MVLSQRVLFKSPMSSFHHDLFSANLLQLYNLMNSLMQNLYKLDKLFITFFVFIFTSVGTIYLLVSRVGFGMAFVFLGLRGFVTIATILSSLFRRESKLSFIMAMASYVLYEVINPLVNFVFFLALVTFSLDFHSLSRLCAMGLSRSFTLGNGCF